MDCLFEQEAWKKKEEKLNLSMLVLWRKNSGDIKTVDNLHLASKVSKYNQ